MRYQAVAEYLRQASTDFEVRQLDDGWSLSTPFVRPDGEVIEVQIEALRDDQVRLSDMGDSLGYLYVNGLTLSKSLMESIHRICPRIRCCLESERPGSRCGRRFRRGCLA